MNKRILMILSTILVVVLGVTGATFALLTTQSGERSNEFHPGVLTATIIENGEDPDHQEELTPDGNQSMKEVQVLNVNNPHEVDAYIRVMLVPTFRTHQGSQAGDMSLQPNGQQISIAAPDHGEIILILQSDWAEHWIHEDGIFYHREIVKPGETTAKLLERVEVSDNGLWHNFQLEVLSDAIQSENGALGGAWGEVGGM